MTTTLVKKKTGFLDTILELLQELDAVELEELKKRIASRLIEIEDDAITAYMYGDV